MDTPKLSVITGVYNIGKLTIFDRMIRSVLSQSFSEFEWIICDDGSTDSTWERLETIAANDNRIRLLKSPVNEGLASALNRCIAICRAPLIARQDADDLSAPERFALQVLFLQEHSEADFVGSNVILFDETGAWGKRIFPVRPEKQDFLFSMPFVHGALMFRTTAIQMAGNYRVAKETRRAEDYDLLMRMYAEGMVGGNLEQSLYWFLEDKAAKRRRKYCYRIDEFKIRSRGFRALGLWPRGIPYALKPLLVGVLPLGLLDQLKTVAGKQTLLPPGETEKVDLP